MSKPDPHAFSRFMDAQEKERHAMSRFSLASREVEIARIICRSAEFQSQSYEYVANGVLRKQTGEITDRERALMISAIFWVLYGREPERKVGKDGFIG